MKERSHVCEMRPAAGPTSPKSMRPEGPEKIKMTNLLNHKNQNTFDQFVVTGLGITLNPTPSASAFSVWGDYGGMRLSPFKIPRKVERWSDPFLSNFHLFCHMQLLWQLASSELLC